MVVPEYKFGGCKGGQDKFLGERKCKKCAFRLYAEMVKFGLIIAHLNFWGRGHASVVPPLELVPETTGLLPLTSSTY